MGLIIDPPGGWKYGFPKLIPDDIIGKPEQIGEWLLSQGYPEQDIDLALKYSRYWSDGICK